MILDGSFTIAAPRDTVWGFLNDIPRVSACLPGVDALEEVRTDVYRGQLRVRVGPIKAAFGGEVTVLERDPPERLVAQAEGDDKTSASRVKATFTARLVPVESGTRVDYQLDVALRGRLAQFGSTVFQATSRKMAQEFAARMQAELERGE